MQSRKTLNMPLPSDVKILERVEYKTICYSYTSAFDIAVNNAVEEGWKLEKRFINSKGEFIAFMIRETWEEQ